MLASIHETINKVKELIDNDNDTVLKTLPNRGIWNHAMIITNPFTIPDLTKLEENQRNKMDFYTIKQPSPLQYAIYKGSRKCANLLLLPDPDTPYDESFPIKDRIEEIISCRNASTRIHSLHFAILCLKLDIIQDIIKLMEKHDLKPNEAYLTFKTNPLHTALQIFDVNQVILREIVSALLNANCSLFKENDMSIAPIQILLRSNFQFLMELLLESSGEEKQQFIYKKRNYMFDGEVETFDIPEYLDNIEKYDQAKVLREKIPPPPPPQQCFVCKSDIPNDSEPANDGKYYCSRHIPKE